MKVSPSITRTMIGRLSVGLEEKIFPYRCLVFHILPKRYQYGYEEDWYDGPWPSFGFGPLLLICWRF